MFRSILRISAASLAIAMVLTACDAGTDPDIVPLTQDEQAAVGTYALITGNGSNPPIATGTTTGGCNRFIDRGQLVLKDDREYFLSLDMRAQCPNTVTSNATGSGRWSMTGSTIRFVNGGTGSEIDPGDGALSGGTITTTIGMEWVGQLPPVTLVLRR